MNKKTLRVLPTPAYKIRRRERERQAYIESVHMAVAAEIATRIQAFAAGLQDAAAVAAAPSAQPSASFH